MDVRMYGLTDEISPCVLQDIVPYRVRCPKSKRKSKRKKGKGKEKEEEINQCSTRRENTKNKRKNKTGEEKEEGEEDDDGDKLGKRKIQRSGKVEKKAASLSPFSYRRKKGPNRHLLGSLTLLRQRQAERR